tara:strand:- start:196 stop:675 length:480 start_codon:yes stop_codon:yes gene_type:complete
VLPPPEDIVTISPSHTVVPADEFNVAVLGIGLDVIVAAAILSSKSVLDSVPIAAPVTETVNVLNPGLLKSTTKVTVELVPAFKLPLDKIVLLTEAFTPVRVRLILSEVAPKFIGAPLLFLIVTPNSYTELGHVALSPIGDGGAAAGTFMPFIWLISIIS